MKKEIYRRNIADLKRQKKGLQYNYTQLILSFFIYFQTLLVEAQVHWDQEKKKEKSSRDKSDCYKMWTRASIIRSWSLDIWKDINWDCAIWSVLCLFSDEAFSFFFLFSWWKNQNSLKDDHTTGFYGSKQIKNVFF